jgi:hypothetical protein
MLLGATVVAGFVDLSAGLGGWLVLAEPLALVGAAVSLGPWLVLLTGRRAGRSRRVTTMLAGRRLVADPRTPGRVAGVLLAVGLATGVALAGIGSTVDQFGGRDTYGGGIWFYLGGYLLALAGIGFAGAVGAASLLVGATESVLDARRPTASLAALGADRTVIRGVLSRQLRVVALVPSVLGAVAGWLLWGGALIAVDSGRTRVATLVALPCAVLLAVSSARAGVWVAEKMVRTPLDEAMDPLNLRTA